LKTTSENFLSENEHFCKSALSRFTPEDFISLVKTHNIAFHEKKLGQLFCDNSARDIVQMLEKECLKNGVEFKFSNEVTTVLKVESTELPHIRFEVRTNQGTYNCHSLVIATGGLSIPKVGASRFGYKIAEQFGLKIVSPQPALDGFALSDHNAEAIKELAGVSLDCILTAHGKSFRENILFTHKGLSGPAALQGSLYWNSGEEISINLIPDTNCLDFFMQKKKDASPAHFKTLLVSFLPERFVNSFCSTFLGNIPVSVPLSQMSDKNIQFVSKLLHDWRLKPCGTVGYAKAEVTRGGVSTEELSSKTLEVKKVPGLYFIGELVDVTGWLGGYNFQWAWASGWAAAQSL
jgi:predicted Rossmann fold flavoprotein